MASKMTSPADSIDGQNGRNEESEECCLSDAEKMEVDCDGCSSSIDPQPEDPVQISSLPKCTFKGCEVSNVGEDEDNSLAMASKMTSPAESIGGQTGRNEDSLSDADKMEVDPQPEDPVQISSLLKDTDGASRENQAKSKVAGSWPSKTDQISHSLSLALFGSTAAVKVGCGSLLSDFSGRPTLTQLTPTECNIAGCDVTVINMIGLHEIEYHQQSMDNYMGQTLGEDGIHAFLYMLPPHRLTDGDKMAVEWLQRVFGPSSLHFLIIVFTYENEEDCDSIVDDLKGNTVLEQLIEKSGGRYFTSNKTLNNEIEMRLLLKKIDLMIYENKTYYTAESYSEQLKKRQAISNNEDSGNLAEDVDRKDSPETEDDDSGRNEEKSKGEEDKNIFQTSANNDCLGKNTQPAPGSGSNKTSCSAEDVDRQDSTKTENADSRENEEKPKDQDKSIFQTSDLDKNATTASGSGLSKTGGPAEDVDRKDSTKTENADSRENEDKPKDQEDKSIFLFQTSANNSDLDKNATTASGSGLSKTGGPAEDVDKKHCTENEEEEQCQERAENPSKKKEEPRTNNEQELKELFERLNLTYNNRLSTSDILKIDARSCQPQDAKVGESDIAHTFLHRLLMTDYRARYIPIKEENNELSQTNVECKENDDGDVFTTLFNKTDMKNEGVKKQSQIHPMDVQMAVFHSADPFLRQYLLIKLSMCQYALPLLVPNPFTSEIEFPLWALRQVWKSWKSTDASDKVTIHNEPMYGVETPMVSVFRLGHVSTSKSQLINSLINERHHTFFHRHSPGSSRTRLLMDGVVEIAWYCPSGKKNTDHFPECVAICNLHGDGQACKMQQTILSEMASVNVVFLPNLSKNDTSMAIVNELFASSTPLICLLTEDDSLLDEVRKGKFKMGLRDRNQSDIVGELKRAINDSLSQRNFRLENLKSQTGIKVDENDEDCRKGETFALQIKELLEGDEVSNVKKTFLPCQGKLWHEWCQKNKDLFRLHGNVEKQMSRIKKEMGEIRSIQKQSGISVLMKLFLEAVDELSPIGTMYFLKWTSILMDAFTSDELVALHHKYDEKWKKVLRLKKKVDKPEELEKEQSELENISDQLNAATFGLEHILREMGQIYEAEISVKRDKGNNLKLPAMAAELMLSGHPLELMDGDAAHVPITWISAVLDEVKKKIGNKRIFVLSVLGIQSTGKSTMLNAMFGLQFAVSAGRCTRGAFMQLVHVTEDIKAKFDYFLVVDTEGLRALELAGKATIHHDNELATFVIGLGHMTLINIFGENPSEMQDIIQIAVQAFLRMKKVKLSPSCLFVHQNVGDITAGEKNMEGKRRLQDKLDEMTLLAAKEEDGNAKSFSDVIAFDIQKDVKYFAQLWEGSPPMAPPNPSYSENVQDLKATILKKASQSKGVKLSEFRISISDLWNALLNENFVFSFKNTLEIAMYRKLETEYSTWTWRLRKAMLHIEDKLHNRIDNVNHETIEERLLFAEMKPTYDDIKKTMAKYFDEHKDREMLVQWRGRFECKISDIHSDLVKETHKKLNDIIQQKRTQKKLNERKEHYKNTLYKKSKELALSVKNLGRSEKAQKEEFDRMWVGWLPELTSELPRVKDCNIWQDVMSVLSERYEESILNSQFKQPDFKRITDRGDYSKYVVHIAPQSQEPEQATKKKGRNFLFTVWGKLSSALLPRYFKTHVLDVDDQESIKGLAQNVHEQAENIIKKYFNPALGYRKTYIQEIAESVRESVADYEQNVMQGRYSFKKVFTIDLTLFVCDIACNTFSELHRKFQKATDGFIYLEDQKDHYYKVFRSFCQGAESSAALGHFICSKLEPSIRQALYDKTAIDIANEMQTNSPVFNGNRLNLEKHILHSLAEEENFNTFLKYIHNPKEHFKSFITQQIKQFMATGKSPTLNSKMKGTLKDKAECARNAAHSATEKVKKKKGDANMWLSHFSEELKDELKFAEKSCVDASEITQFDFLEEIICNGLKNILDQLMKSFSKISHLKTEDFDRRPDEILIKHFCNCCWVQCPFCKAICTNTLGNHEGTDHSVPFHRTNGLNGWHFRGTTNLCVDFCTTGVSSDARFYPSSKSKNSIPMKEYRKGGPKYADWSITPDNSELPYWKWFMWRFKDDLEKHYKKTFQGDGEMPQEWSQYTKAQAIKSLDVYALTDLDT